RIASSLRVTSEAGGSGVEALAEAASTTVRSARRARSMRRDPPRNRAVGPRPAVDGTSNPSSKPWFRLLRSVDALVRLGRGLAGNSRNEKRLASRRRLLPRLRLPPLRLRRGGSLRGRLPFSPHRRGPGPPRRRASLPLGTA